MKYTINDSKRIYSHIQDSYSRFIYEKRVMWSLTGDDKYMTDILESLLDYDSIGELMEKANEVKDKLVIRGVGNDYRVIKGLYPTLECAFFVDYDPTKQGKYVDGKKILSPEDYYDNYSDYYVMVNSAAANGEIVNELLEHGISDDRILNLGKCYEGMCDKQYFEKDILPVYENEVFIDGGCYDGRTIRQFIKYCGGDYKKIYSFEPDKSNYHRTLRMLESSPVDRLEVINKGLWNESTILSFLADANQASKISEQGSFCIDTVSIDEVVGEEKVTFIKLDVEGAEYKALEGARRTIERDHPKLAISIYHKSEDIFELPELILSMCENYRFYLRHYQLSPNETILYGV